MRSRATGRAKEEAKPAQDVAPLAAADTAVPPWTVTFAVLSILLVTLSWFPLAKLTAHYEMGPNEGFNAYFQQTAASGGQVYGQPPEFYYANYPPLSFHLVGWVGRITGDMNLAGRWVSLLAWLLIGLFIALSVERLTGSRRYGLYSGLCWLVWIAALDMNRIGFNDPHLLGIALNVAAFYCYLRDPESPKWLAASALLFALSLFTKQTLLAFPAAVAIQLFLSARKRLWTWLATAAAASLALFLLTWVVDGGYFLQHLALPRTYSWAGTTGNAATYLTFIQGAFVAALIWIFRHRSPSSASVLIWSFAFAHVLGLVYAAGDGASTNHLFDALVVTAMIVGLVLPALEGMAESSPFPRTALAVSLIVPFFLTSLLVLPQRIPSDSARNRLGTPALEAEFANAVKFVRAQPGPALCENLLLCYEAGKPETYDAFAVDQAIKTGHLQEQRVLQLLADHHYGLIQIEVAQSEALGPVARHRFSAAFMTQLLASYRLAARSSRHALFIPKAAGG